MKKVTYTPVFNRKKKLNSEGLGIIQIQVYANLQRKYFSTGIYVLPESWDPDKRVVVNHARADMYNFKIKAKIRELEAYEMQSIARGEIFSFDSLPSSQVKKDFLTYMREKIQNEDLAPGTRRQHNATLNHLIRFGKIISFFDITDTRILEFDQYLKREKLALSSIYGQHKRLKKWVRMAYRENRISKDPYQGLIFPAGNRDQIKYLSNEDLQKIEEKEFQVPRLNQVRDMFLFSCYTGLAYGEISQLNSDQISTEEDGTVWITGKRLKVSGNQKNGASGEYFVPLSTSAIAILKRYKKKGLIFPELSNQKYNSYLKEVQEICNIKLNLTTHIARHTFATRTLNQGVSLESVSKMLGHSSVRMTEKYAKILKNRVKQEMKNII